MEQEYTIDNSYLSPEAQKRKKDLEENPASRTNHMEYMDCLLYTSPSPRDCS